MKVIQIFLIGCLFLITVLGGCQSKTPEYTTATPEGTIRLYIQAQCELDAEKLAGCYVEEERERVKADAERGFEQLYSFSVENLKVEVVSQTDSTAKVKVRCDKIVSPVWSKGEYRDVYKNQVSQFNLEKQGNEWLIKTPN